MPRRPRSLRQEGLPDPEAHRPPSLGPTVRQDPRRDGIDGMPTRDVPPVKSAPTVQTSAPTDKSSSAATGAPSAQLAWMLRDPALRRQVRAWHEQTYGVSATDALSEDQLVRAIAAEVEAGRLQLAGVKKRATAPKVVPLSEASDDAPPPQKSKPLVEHWIEFQLLDGNGEPIGGIDYVLVDPSGQEQDGSFGEDGTLHEAGVDPGTYTLLLPGIDEVRWGTRNVRWDQPTTVEAETTGLADGASVEVKFYRFGQEKPDDAVATLSGSIEADAVSVEWTPDVQPDTPPGEPATVPYVAEVSADGSWLKTVEPLVVERRGLTSVAWSTEEVAEGGRIDVIVQTTGLADGATVTLEIHELGWMTDDTLIETLESEPVEGGRTVTAWAPLFDPPADGELTLHPELYVVAKLEDHVLASGLALCKREVYA